MLASTLATPVRLRSATVLAVLLAYVVAVVLHYTPTGSPWSSFKLRWSRSSLFSARRSVAAGQTGHTAPETSISAFEPKAHLQGRRKSQGIAVCVTFGSIEI